MGLLLTHAIRWITNRHILLDYAWGKVKSIPHVHA